MSSVMPSPTAATDHPLWLLDQPLLLASGSVTRRTMLAAAGIPMDACAAAIDERRVEQRHLAAGGCADGIAEELARAKALHVSAQFPDRLVLGADQTLTCAGTAFHKPTDLSEVQRQLEALSGRSHCLTSAYAVVRNSIVLAAGRSSAVMTMRALSPSFIARYLQTASDQMTNSVGGYQLENLGSHLFSTVEGDHFTVLGLPLLNVLSSLRTLGAVAE